MAGDVERRSTVVRGSRALAVAGVALCALLPTELLATTYYVNDGTTAGDVAFSPCTTAPLGADTSSCGGCSNPCASPNYLYAKTPLEPGDTVLINAGAYTPGPLGAPFLNLVDLSKSGDAGLPITFRGVVDTAGRPLTTFNANAVAPAGIRIASNWVSVENISVTNTACTSNVPYGSGVFVDLAPLVGISLVNLEVFGTNCSWGTGIDFESSAPTCTGCRIVGCSVHDNGPVTLGGLWLYDSGGIEIRDNLIFRNAVGGNYPGIWLQGTPNAKVEGNLIWGNGGPAIYMTKCTGCLAPSNMTVRGNTFWRNQAASTGTKAEVEVWQGVTNLTFEDNIVGAVERVCLDIDATTTFASSNYNDFFPISPATVGSKGGSTASDLAAWQALTGQDGQSISQDPLFGGPNDFHLKSRAGRPNNLGMRVFDTEVSPAIDRANPTRPFSGEPAPNGGRANLGAYGAGAQASLTPVQLVYVRGDGQSGPPLVQLPVPLEVRVVDVGTNRPESDLVVTFTPTTGSGSVTTPSVPADDAGLASTFATPNAGTNQFVADVANVGGVLPFSFNVTGGAAGDGGSLDGGGVSDGGTFDGGATDGGLSDAGSSDGGSSDGGSSDGGKPDGGSSDGGKLDGGSSDGGSSDGGQSDGGQSDGGQSDGGQSDGGQSDAGSADGGGPGGPERTPIVDLGCGCHGAPGAPFSLFLLVVLARAARRLVRPERRASRN